MIPFERALQGRRVLVTGHSGFKGSWLSLWLANLGADVYGISLEPDSTPNLFSAIQVENFVHHTVQDIRERDATIEKIEEIDPEVVFHLAAQPLVRLSYDEPLNTFETTILGTASVLEGCRRARSTQAVVCVTTDKVYDNREWVWPYREIDKLGGKDPYSASKAAAEMVAACYGGNLLPHETGGTALATARGGNVIGGGDWSSDRLVPDLVRAIVKGRSLSIRNPEASRPWQHVLTLCHGYLQLAAGLLTSPAKHRGAWNFGPDESGVVTVRSLLQHFEEAWMLPRIEEHAVTGKTESQLLSLDSSKAQHILKWRPPWSLEDAVSKTAEWYQGHNVSPKDALSLTQEQIQNYRTALISNNEN